MAFKDNQEKLRTAFREFINPDMSKETIDQVASFTALLDNMQADYDSVEKQYNDLKSDYINVVKNSSFKVDHNPMEDDIGGTKSEEDLANEIFGKFFN